MSWTSRLFNKSHARAHHPNFTPKACGERAFLYQIIWGYGGDIGEFIKGPHPQGYMYDTDGHVTVGILPYDPVLGKTTTWGIEHMLDVQNFNASAGQTNITQEASFNDKDIC